MLLFSPNGYTCSSSFPRLSERAPAHISLMPRSPPADRVVFGHLAAGGPSRALEIKTSQLTRGGECSCVLRACHREVPGKAPGQSRDSNDKNRDTRLSFLIFTSYKISHCLTWTPSIATATPQRSQTHPSVSFRHASRSRVSRALMQQYFIWTAWRGNKQLLFWQESLPSADMEAFSFLFRL